MIFLTGSSGPLGYAFQKVYGDIDNIYVTSSDFDLCDKNETLNYLVKTSKTRNIDGIIHMAAQSGGVAFSNEKPATLLTKNVEMCINIIESAIQIGCSRIILVLSTACYDPNIVNPNEDQILDGKLLGNDYSYAYAKRLMVPMMWAFNKQYNLNISCVVVNGIVGPNMNYIEGQSTLVASQIKKFYAARNNQQQIDVWGDGSPLREYTYSYDLARAIYWCYHNQQGNSVLNIGNTLKLSVRQVVEIIANRFEVDSSRIRFDSGKPNGRPLQSTDNKKFIELSGFEFKTPKESIELACDWYMENI
jgi:GDP-L-fucose synthase